jgi:hypothetical protein
VAIDQLLSAAGWAVQDLKAAHVHAARGVALREFELNAGHGTADYLLYVDGKAAGVVEAKKQGATLTGVEMARAQTPVPPGLEQQRIVAEVDRRFSIIREFQAEAEVDAKLKRGHGPRQAALTSRLSKD